MKADEGGRRRRAAVTVAWFLLSESCGILCRILGARIVKFEARVSRDKILQFLKRSVNRLLMIH